MSKRVYFILGLFLLISACQPTIEKELTDIQRQKTADAIRQRTQEWSNSFKEFNNETVDKYLDFFVESDGIYWTNNPALYVINLTILPTKEKMEDFFRPAVDKYKDYTQDIEIVKDYIAILSEDKAIHVLNVNTLMTDTEGNIFNNETGIVTFVYVRINDVWKVLHSHISYEKI